MTNPTQSDCLHAGPRPLIWVRHDAEDSVDLCRCQDCGEEVAMEPCEDDLGCELCGAFIDAEGACENCWGVDDA
jgi:hypothetical protein